MCNRAGMWITAGLFTLLRASLAGADARAVTSDTLLTPVVFEPLESATEQTASASGSFAPGAPDWVYLPVEVPEGVRELAVSYDYDRPTVPAGERNNGLDIGIFDQDGIELGNARGFRGWSGGFRTNFALSRSEATPGYLPGPIDPGRWYILIAPYSVATQGLHWKVDVTVRYGDPGAAFVPNYPPLRAAGRGEAWYRGDMHLHTVYSDGKRLPEEVAAGARAAGLDYIVSTDHNTSSSHAVWGPLAGPDLLILTGEEITTRNGHYLALGLPAGEWIDWRYRALDDVLPDLVRQIHRGDAIAVAAHPYAPCVACSWKFGYANSDAIEVWNGPWTLDDEVALATWDNLLVATAGRGRFIPAVGDSDAHSDPQVIGLPHNVVHARDLERTAILNGVRRGSLWLAESAAVDLSFAAQSGGRSAGIGQRLSAAPSDEVTVSLNVSGAEGGLVRLFSDEGQILEAPLPATGPGTVTWTTKPQVSHYVRAEVRRMQDNPALPTTMVALTNPILLGD